MQSSGTQSFVASLVLALAGGAFGAAQAQADMTTGEVTRVDRDKRMLTLRHGKIANLDMPAMTMEFSVRNPALLNEVRVGDKVLFRAVIEDKVLAVTELRKVR